MLLVAAVLLLATGASFAQDGTGNGSNGGGAGNFWNWFQNNVGGGYYNRNTNTGGACVAGFCASGGPGGFSFGNGQYGAGGPYYHPQITAMACTVLGIPEGSFGALVMIVAGIIAIVSGALGAYRAALSTIVIGAGSWILAPIVGLFFPLPCL